MAKSYEEIMGSVSPAVRKAAVRKAAKYQKGIDASNAVKALRGLSGLSQTEFAKRMKISQPAMAKMERQNDMKLSTLAEMVEEAGGEMSIQVKMPGRSKVVSIGYRRSKAIISRRIKQEV